VQNLECKIEGVMRNVRVARDAMLARAIVDLEEMRLRRFVVFKHFGELIIDR
jgi:hypothetical protein